VYDTVPYEAMDLGPTMSYHTDFMRIYVSATSTTASGTRSYVGPTRTHGRPSDTITSTLQT